MTLGLTVGIGLGTVTSTITEVNFSRSFLSFISSINEFPEEGVLEFKRSTVGMILSE